MFSEYEKIWNLIYGKKIEYLLTSTFLPIAYMLVYMTLNNDIFSH